MDVRDLSFNELADQDVGTVGDRLRHSEDVPTLGMSPPASANPTTDHRLRETRNRAVGGLENHAMVFDEG
jgi:hypothetical protein